MRLTMCKPAWKHWRTKAPKGNCLVLSQILVCWDYEASSPLLVEPLRGESVELFGRTEARLTAPFELPLAEHMYEFNAGEGGLRGVERLEP